MSARPSHIQADLLTGLLHLDQSGRVAELSDLPLHQPGLLLGASDSDLLGSHISEILPSTTDRAISDFYLPDLGRGGFSLASTKKGGMKADKGES
jgi:hypothetical protein